MFAQLSFCQATSWPCLIQSGCSRSVVNLCLSLIFSLFFQHAVGPVSTAHWVRHNYHLRPRGMTKICCPDRDNTFHIQIMIHVLTSYPGLVSAARIGPRLCGCMFPQQLLSLSTSMMLCHMLCRWQKSLAVYEFGVSFEDSTVPLWLYSIYSLCVQSG